MGLASVIGLASTARSETLPGGARGVKIVLNNSTETFTTVTATSGSTDVARGGFYAATFRDPGTGASISKPAWLTDVALSSKSDCARFATSTESATCHFAAAGTTFACGGAQNIYRVSEYDCEAATTGVDVAGGTGAYNDPVAVRIFLNRATTALGSTENLMVVLEYQASGLMQAPASPGACMNGDGTYKLTDPDCVDQAYGLFIRAKDSSTTSKLQTLIPPQGGFVNATNSTAGAPVQTRQIIVPLSSLATTDTVLQISRIYGLETTAKRGFSDKCAANSPLCLGLVLHSITLYRM